MMKWKMYELINDYVMIQIDNNRSDEMVNE